MMTPTKNEETTTIKCPFCGTDDFDLVGLKGHLVHGDCDVYEETRPPISLF